MKNKLILIISLLLFVVSSNAQKMNTKYHDPKLNKEVLVGYCNENGLQQDDFGKIFMSEYEHYIPEKSLVRKIKSIYKKNNIEVVTVFAEWCHDSKEQVPHFYKLMDKAGFSKEKTKIIAVDRTKNAQIVNISDLNILKVPTFIIYSENIEIGRIIETPEHTLELDLLNILKSIR
jgi:thiol-disulfide isomerase/thioredoxin